MAISDAPVKCRDRNSAGSTSGLRLVRQWATKAPTRTAAPASAATVRTDAQHHPGALTSPKLSRATPPVASTTPDRAGRAAACPGTAGSRSPPPDDQGGHADGHVDQEHPPPAGAHQQAAHDRPDGGRRAGRGGGCEHGHAHQERPVPPETVGEPAEEHQKRGVDDGVTVEDPRQVAQARSSQISGYAGQGQVDDEQIEAGQGTPEQTITSTSRGVAAYRGVVGPAARVDTVMELTLED